MNSLFKTLPLLAVVLFISCTGPLHKKETVRLKRVTVYICPDSSYFPPACTSFLTKGCATSKKEIYVIGKMVNGKIVTDDKILGHELRHLLNWENPKIANPDSY